MLITYHGREYNTARRVQANDLAFQLGVHFLAGDPQHDIDAALWAAILARVGKGVLAPAVTS